MPARHLRPTLSATAVVALVALIAPAPTAIAQGGGGRAMPAHHAQGAGYAAGSWVAASRPGTADGTARTAMHLFGGGPSSTAKAGATAGGRAITTPAKRSVDLEPCDFDDTFLCGTVTMPLDRAHPQDGRTIGVHISVAPHTGDRAKPKGTIVATSGGPGEAMSGGEMYGWRDYLVAPLTEDYDLVFIDQRGTGLSQAIDCPAWQHETPTYRAAAACARSLGDTRNFYGSAEVADDTDVIRKALGLKKIIVAGGSYGGNDVVTYTARHPSHVTMAVASSPYLPVGDDTFAPYVPEAMPGIVELACQRDVSCDRANPDPGGALAWLAKRLRAAPVVGTGYDADGQPHDLRVTEAQLVNAILWNDLGQGEVAQAAVALRAGDAVPLLRLGAENDPQTWTFDSGDPRYYSNGDNLARFCNDADLPWDETAPKGVRWHQYEAALAAEPATYGPFSKGAWRTPLPYGSSPSACIASTWNVQQGYRSGTKVHGIPSLILLGEYDLNVPRANAIRAADVLVGAKVVDVAMAGHNPWWWRECAAQTVQKFIATGHVTDVCATDPMPDQWFVGSFPSTVSGTPKAARLGGDNSTATARRIATAAVWTVVDSMDHTYRSESHAGRALRGGSVVIDWSEEEGTPDVFHLDKVRFVDDLTVTGTADSNWWISQYDAAITVRAPDGTRGALTIVGVVNASSADVFEVSGTVDGRTVHLSVPAT